MQSNAQIVDIEYQQGICSPTFVVEEFLGLFAYPSIFLIKDSISAYKVYGNLTDFISSLNSHILLFSDGIAIPQKCLFLHTFS